MTSGSISDRSEAVAATRFQEQAILLLNLEEIYKQNSKTHDNANPALYKNDYSNYNLIDPASSFSSDVISGLTKNTNAALFSHIPPAILSFLVPTIRIYKVFYPKKDSSGIPWQVPFDDYLGSSDFSNKSIEELMTRKQGRLNGAGIKSFTYNYVAINPAEVETNIEANLELTFYSAEDLLKEINVGNLNSDEASQNLTFKYTDLVNQSIKEKGATLAWNYSYYRIQALVGYSIPNDEVFKRQVKSINDFKFNTDELIDSLMSAIKQTKVLLFLNPVTHEVDFTESGVVNLNIRYRAAIDTILSQPEADLFCLSNGYQNLQTLLSEQNVANIEFKSKIEDLKKAGNCNKENIKKALREQRTKFTKATENLKTTKAEIYSSLLEKLIDEKSLYAVEVPPEDLGILPQGTISSIFFDPDIAGYDQVAAKRLEKFRDRRQQLRFYKHNNIDMSGNVGDIDYFNLYNEQIKQAYQSSTSNEETKEKLAELLKNTQAYEQSGQYKFYYFYLGDLINITLEVLKKITPTDSIPKVILGPIDLYLPNRVIGQQPNRLSINMADIPISFNLFLEFFVQKVVANSREKYPIKYFLNDVFEYLVSAALSPRAFGTSYIGSRERLTIVPLTISATSSRTEPIFQATTWGGQIITDKEMKGCRSRLVSDVELFTSYGSINYLVIYASSQFPSSFSRTIQSATNEEDKLRLNIQKGIFNFSIGTDAGLLKSVKFKKVDQPFLREARAENEGEIEEGKFIGKYNADVTTFGNNIFRPGDIIYISPDFYVTANASSLSANGSLSNDQVKKLITTTGVGGYYMINKINTTLTEGKYETSFDCMFQAYGDGTELDTSGNNISDCQDTINEALSEIGEEERKAAEQSKVAPTNLVAVAANIR